MGLWSRLVGKAVWPLPGWAQAGCRRSRPRSVTQPRRGGLRNSAGSSTGPRSQPSVRHVDEPRVVALEGDGDVAGRAVAVLGDDQVGLAGAGRLLLVDVVTVQQ